MASNIGDERNRFLHDEFDKKLETDVAEINEKRAGQRFYDWIDRRALGWTRTTFGSVEAEKLQRGFNNIGSKSSCFDQPRHADLYRNAHALRYIIENFIVTENGAEL